MKKYTKNALKENIKLDIKLNETFWFIALGVMGITTTAILAYITKLIIKIIT